ncbi:glycosyl hydrolase [Muricoccus pecuniae]|uniref:GH26 domain-containing protein n=1 Tax=Muricoccus pecuniae TaxID=693023 RepID=A0A840YGG7_9PROT|nr:glycosyl hydrolase [Roseomonas pecuniae]MBB5693013.1 hypothetical protein [Roseomonas pecuniae]
MTLTGVYVGNSKSALQSFENWLGSEVDAVHGVVGFSNWRDYTSSANWAANDLWRGINEEVLWSVSLIVTDGSASLAQAGTGAYNNYYRSVAQSLLNSRAGDSDPIYVRTGWELNGDWFKWSAVGKSQDFVSAFREFVDSFREVSDRFKFEWNVNYAHGGMDPATAYPGDNYVDVVGMDFYWSPDYQGWDPVKAFEAARDAKYGLQWLENFAKAHGKQTAYSEWGIDSNNAGEYIRLVKEWFNDHNVAYESYWNVTMDKVTAMSDGGISAAGAVYKSLFGDNGDDTPAAMPAASPTTSTPSTTASSAGNGTSRTGTSGNDVLTGNGGENLAGGAGNDTYEVNSSSTVVTESSGGGTDTVRTWLGSYVLPSEVENLIVTGTGWATATGNGLANTLTGNAAPNVLNGMGGNDRLVGGGGNDTLSGGGGDDRFIINRGEGSDTITDFRSWERDVVELKGYGTGLDSYSDLSWRFQQSGDNVIVRLGNGENLTIQHAKVADLTADHFLFG